jgi:hypothetical protein
MTLSPIKEIIPRFIQANESVGLYVCATTGRPMCLLSSGHLMGAETIMNAGAETILNAGAEKKPGRISMFFGFALMLAVLLSGRVVRFIRPSSSAEFTPQCLHPRSSNGERSCIVLRVIAQWGTFMYISFTANRPIGNVHIYIVLGVIALVCL